MHYIKHILATLLLGCVATAIGVIVLHVIGAQSGWYYGLVISVNTVVTYRILVLALGDPSAHFRALRKRGKEERRLPRPIH
jgi:hypothetical protein